MSCRPSDLRKYVFMYQDELQRIAANAVSWGNRETGGELLGLWSHAGRPVAMLTTLPGPNAVHQAAHFSQDPEYCRQNLEILQELYVIQLLGDWHCHHDLQLSHPSPGDARHIAAIARKNHLSTMVEIILTFDRESCPDVPLSGIIPGSCTKRQAELDLPYRTAECSGSHTHGIGMVRVHAYLFDNAPEGKYVECPIKLLPGESPIRMALKVGDLPVPGAVDPYPHPWPLDRIRWESADQHDPRTLPAAPNVRRIVLCADWRRLPKRVMQMKQEHATEDLAAFSLPLPGDQRLLVTCEQPPSQVIRALHVLADHGSQSIDMAALLEEWSESVCLSQLYDTVATIMARWRQIDDSQGAQLLHPASAEEINRELDKADAPLGVGRTKNNGDR